MLAQRYPDGYDGILAGAPAINWDRFHPGQLWPQVVKFEEVRGNIPTCVYDAAIDAAVKHCDGLDGVRDGILDDPVVVTSTRARWSAKRSRAAGRSPKLMRRRSGGSGTARVTVPASGSGTASLSGHLSARSAVPTRSSSGYSTRASGSIKIPTGTGGRSTMTTTRTSSASRSTCSTMSFGTDDPDLSAFRDAGGKVLIWHGWNDPLIFPEGSVDYYEAVLDAFDSAAQVQRFARLFLAPAVGHCGGGPGPNQFDMFGALVDWVENGDAPDEIIASRMASGEVVRTRRLCAYPYVARYDGRGDPDLADSFDCKPNYGQSGTANRR